MAMTLPTVDFDTPVSLEYLGGWGMYAPKGDSLALTKAVVSLLDDKERAMELGIALRSRALRLYSSEKAGSKPEEIYRVPLESEPRVVPIPSISKCERCTRTVAQAPQHSGLSVAHWSTRIAAHL